MAHGRGRCSPEKESSTKEGWRGWSPSRYRETAARGGPGVEEVPYRAANWRRASFSIPSYIFHLRDQPFVPGQAITPARRGVTVARRTRAERSRRGLPGFCFARCVPKSRESARAHAHTGSSPAVFPGPFVRFTFRERIVDIFFPRHPVEWECATFFLFFYPPPLFSSLRSPHHRRSLIPPMSRAPLTSSRPFAREFIPIPVDRPFHPSGKFHRASGSSDRRSLAIRAQPVGMVFV